jgi:hypothetical protein
MFAARPTLSEWTETPLRLDFRDTTILSPYFPDSSVVSTWRLRLFPEKPSASNNFLPKRPSNPMGESKNVRWAQAKMGRLPAALCWG